MRVCVRENQGSKFIPVEVTILMSHTFSFSRDPRPSSYILCGVSLNRAPLCPFFCCHFLARLPPYKSDRFCVHIQQRCLKIMAGMRGEKAACEVETGAP